jgi:hypothetical protein
MRGPSFNMEMSGQPMRGGYEMTGQPF